MSLAIGMTGLLGEHMMGGRVREASRAASEQMALIESIGDPTSVVGLSVVAMAVKHESTLAVEDERVGRAGRREGAGDVLGLVVEVRKRPAVAAGLGDHLIGPVLRVGDDVIAGDADHRDAPIGELPTERGEAPAATCWTYGQWLQMKVTTSAAPVSSSRLTVAPVAGSGSANGGAGVPSASMVDSVAMPARVGPQRLHRA